MIGRGNGAGRLLAAVALATMVALTGPTATAADCGGSAGSTCGVSADEANGVYHGLIAVTDQGWVLDRAATNGTTPGCGDCIWIVVLACPTNSPADPGSQSACVEASGSPICRPGQLLYRLYLTTDTRLDQLEGTVCLGGTSQIVAIGDTASADAQRYLRDVTPPDLTVTTRPKDLTLAGLTTYFRASPPALEPVPFGGPTITEVITIGPRRIRWTWGDGDSSGWRPPDSETGHRYLGGGRFTGVLTTEWSATYTVHYAGRSFGPYDATGQLTKDQPFTKRVATSTPVLISGN